MTYKNIKEFVCSKCKRTIIKSRVTSTNLCKRCMISKGIMRRYYEVKEAYEKLTPKQQLRLMKHLSKKMLNKKDDWAERKLEERKRKRLENEKKQELKRKIERELNEVFHAKIDDEVKGGTNNNG